MEPTGAGKPYVGAKPGRYSLGFCVGEEFLFFFDGGHGSYFIFRNEDVKKAKLREREGRRELLDHHGSTHEGKVTWEGTDVLVGTGLLGCGELDGLGFRRAQKLGGRNDVSHEGFRKGIGGAGSCPEGLLAESDCGDSLFQDDEVVTHGDLWNLADVLEGELDLRPGLYLEVLDVELHGVVAGDDDLLGLFLAGGDGKSER